MWLRTCEGCGCEEGVRRVNGVGVCWVKSVCR